LRKAEVGAAKFNAKLDEKIQEIKETNFQKTKIESVF